MTRYDYRHPKYLEARAHGEAWHGKDILARIGWAWHGSAWRAFTRQGNQGGARMGVAVLGMSRIFS